MTRIGYARVSTTDQDLTLQREALTAAGCTVIREEKGTGTTRSGRTELATILDFIRAGDVLVVTRIDRLARSIGDLQDIVRTLKAKGAGVYKGGKRGGVSRDIDRRAQGSDQGRYSPARDRSTGGGHAGERGPEGCAKVGFSEGGDFHTSAA